MSRDLRFAVVDSEEGFAALREEWTALHEQSRPRNPFLSYEWLVACRRAFASCAPPWILTARSGRRLVGAAPLRRETLCGFRVLRHLGEGATEYTGFLTAADQPLLEAGLLEEVAARSGWDLLLLRQAAEPYTRLHLDPPAHNLRRVAGPGEVSPFLSLQPGWERILAEGPPSIRHTRKHVRRWARDDGSIERISGRDATDLPETLAAIEARSWRTEEGALILRSGETRRLVAGALELLAPRGELEIWLARQQEQVAAFHLYLIVGDRMMGWYGSYDQAFRRYAPSCVLHYSAIEHACSAGMREYHLLSGSEHYKAQWTDGVRQSQLLAFCPETLRGYAAMACLVGPRWRFRGHPVTEALRRYAKQIRRRPALLLAPRRLSKLRAY